MEAIPRYHRLALDCLQLAEAARDPAVREQMLRLSELWARMAEQPAAPAEQQAA
jgi:hypothetical protein